MHEKKINAATASYVQDVVYPTHFHRETMPVWLCATLTAVGQKSPDLAQPYTYLDLGCGSGLNTLIAAATNPLGRFIGIDINPIAIEHAKQRAAQLGIHNLHYECLSFEQALHVPNTIPLCDFMVCHGVYSWIATAQQKELQRLIAMYLKPKGVLYLAYMSHPGSGAMATAQKLLYLGTQKLAGSSAEKAHTGITWLQQLTQQGLGYFNEHPRVSSEVARLSSVDPHYLAHELLNPQWNSLHVSDVIQDFEKIGCNFAASATTIENLHAVSLPAQSLPPLLKLEQQGASTALKETYKDMARNQNQRRDIYVRSSPQEMQLSDDEYRQKLLAQHVTRLPAAPRKVPPVNQSLVLKTRIGPVELPMENVAPLLEALEAGPLSYAALARLPAYTPNPGLINQLLQLLAWTGWLHFSPPGSHPSTSCCERLNDYLESHPVGQPPVYIKVLPTIGSAIACPIGIAP